MNYNYPNSTELLKIVTYSNFRPFNKGDYMTFSGVTSDNPLITETDQYTIVIDGHIINMVFHEDEFGGQLYSLIEGL
jgi:hypothetical protein